MFAMAVLTNLLLLLALRLTVTTKVDLQKRIIGGTNCGHSERQYHVRFESPGGSNICGGSMISNRWILTAAHCWNNHIPSEPKETHVCVWPVRGDVVQIAGYGRQAGPNSRKDGPSPTVLQCSTFPVVAKNVPRFNLDNKCTQCFCVNTSRVDTSPGDSGGGVEFNGRIYGVHLGGGNITHRQPSVFADVCHYMNWITTTTGIKPQ